MNRRILDCCCAILDDALTAESLAELEALLADDPQARRDYIRIMRLTALLERHDHKPAQSRGLRLSLSMPKPRIEKKFRVSSFGFRISTLALAAAILLALTAWFLFLPEPRTLNPEPSPTPPASVATLTNTHNAVFANTAAPMQLGQSLPPGPIQLTAGKAQVMFASTAMVDLTGPCEFEMTGPNRGHLTAGTLEAFVPENAKGFTIDLPGGSRVVDLGTRFRVRVDDRGRSVVTVLDGRVQVEHAQRVRALAKGQAVRIVDGRMVPMLTFGPRFKAMVPGPLRDGGFDIPGAAHRQRVDESRSAWVETASDEPIVILRTSSSGVHPHSPPLFVQFTGDPTGGAGLVQAIETTPGVSYDLTFHLTRIGGAAPTLTVEFADASPAETVSEVDPLARREIIIDWPAGQWRAHSVRFTAVSAVTLLRITEPVSSASRRAAPLLDSLELQPATPASEDAASQQPRILYEEGAN